MLAALNFGAVALGVAAALLSASIIAVLLGGSLALTGLESGTDIGLMIGIVSGLATGGWVAGHRARHSERFHGMVTGLLSAFVVVVIARLGDSPASTLVVIWLAVLSVAIAGFAGWLAGWRKERIRQASTVTGDGQS
jgi:putative Ca2+/H+ antiporter (TMEM165/GDT1 family)